VNEHERRSLAEQILTNPLFPLVMNRLEQDAVERGVDAAMTDNEMRAAAMAEVRAIRAFRSNLAAMLRDTGSRKGVPA